MTPITKMTLDELDAEIVLIALQSDALDAAKEWQQRDARLSRPAGTWDRAGRYYPSPEEFQSCCAAIRPPSRAWPYSLWVHVHSIDHVANIYRVDRKQVMRALRILKRRDQLRPPIDVVTSRPTTN